MPLIQYKCYEAVQDYLHPNIHVECGNVEIL